jgi:hypothetical protein
MRIGDYSRYNYFTCKKCQWSFMGIEADVDHLDFVVGQLIGYWCDAYTYPDHTGCPHCLYVVPLVAVHGGGYDGPAFCKKCFGKLPRRADAIACRLQKVSDPDPEPAPYVPPAVYVPPPPPPKPVATKATPAKATPKPVVVAKAKVDPDVKIDEQGRPYKIDSIGRRYYNLDPDGVKIDEEGRPYKIDSIGRRYYNLDPKGVKIDEEGRPYKIDSIGRRYYNNLND